MRAEQRLVILGLHMGKCSQAAISRTLPFLIQIYVFLGFYQKVSHLSQDSTLKFVS